MVKWVRRGCVAAFVSALLPVAVAGLAEAQSQSVVKDIDPYTLTLSLKDVAIQSVPNMAAAPLVREGFITATSELAVVCNKESAECAKNEVAGAVIKMSAQVGCPLDISGGLTSSLDPQLNSSLPLQGILQSVLPPPTPPPAPTPNDITDIALLPNGQITPKFAFNPLPGYIRNVDLGSVDTPKGYDNAEQRRVLLREGKGGDQRGKLPLRISVQNLHMEVDNTDNHLGSCGGTVAVRLYAQAVVDTADSQGTIDIYGDIYVL